MGSFELIPAIDLRDGRCVQLRQGKKEDEIFASAENPVEIARGWVIQGARRLHVIDLDGAFQEEKNNLGVIKKIADAEGVREKAKIQVGGGIRSYETAVELLELGIDRIIFGTVALKSPYLIEQVANAFSPERVMVALDARKGKVAIDGWREVTGVNATEAAKQVERIGAGSLLFTNIDVEGLMEGVEQEIIAEFVSSVSIPVVIAGGVSSVEDIGKIKDAGASGVVMGSALYKGKIDFSELLRRRQGSNL
ncbi:MAG TPA: 1-(5-phosphoribosyl)-5-((5-phosphoribosylamino)methylideneamino)imidazole-4-carboxamide isomerase [Methanophagales archaeon]|nr:1-(5-phosphoribosyl)-5-((5-phosphoribosylamino)methylideneamino)imidazole-4-carboxamide isomerase [Methanophagales archaeon]